MCGSVCPKDEEEKEFESFEKLFSQLANMKGIFVT